MVKKGMKPQKAAEIRAEKGLEMTNLQRLRVAKGLSQSDLSAAAGISVRRIQCYEQGTRPIDGAKIDALCDMALALGCRIEDLLENKGTIAKLRKVK